jgi:hypothetical protein
MKLQELFSSKATNRFLLSFPSALTAVVEMLFVLLIFGGPELGRG